MSKERPILFSGTDVVRALLDGSKTQTRRPVKGFALELLKPDNFTPEYVALPENGNSPYGYAGDRLWVRETWMDLTGTGIERSTGDHSRYAYGADTPPGSYGDQCRKDYGLKWRPSIHMPRPASRITLEVTGVRVERLHDISHDDALAEGVANFASTLNDEPHPSGESPEQASRRLKWPQRQFRALWESINGAESWAANPWVWVVEFKRL